MKISDERLADIKYTALMGTWSQESPATADEIIDITDELQQHRAEKHERRWRNVEKDGLPEKDGEYKVLYSEWSGGGDDIVTWPEYDRWFDDVEWYRLMPTDLPEWE